MLEDIFDMLKATPSLRKHWCSCSKKYENYSMIKSSGMGLVVFEIETAGLVKSFVLYLACLYLNTHNKT